MEKSFLDLYDQFIVESQKGRRLQPNGKKFTAGTIANYSYTRKLLATFAMDTGLHLRIRSVRKLSQREMEVEKNYWRKFYRQFTDYMYHQCGYYDNYVGQSVKNLKVFFNYLNKELAMGIGDFHKSFCVYKEEIAIFPLLPEELNYLIHDQEFERSLTRRMLEVKDFFVFGCTVALRVSDLFSLSLQNIREVNGTSYLSVRSIKTSTDTLVKLPDYAVQILNKYRRKGKKKLLPDFNKTNLNKYIKQLLELAGFVTPVFKTRTRRGMPVMMNKKQKEKENNQRFCDLATTHTMRRTAITSMLSLGVPEQVVRKISGHAPGSKEFYRYVQWAQSYQDQETEKMFNKLGSLSLNSTKVVV